MTQPDILQTILKDSNYHLNYFTDDEVEIVRNKITIKTVRGKETPYIKCTIRNREVQAKPEEIVRQLYTECLLTRYGYPKKRIKFECPINFGREKKRADIVIFREEDPDTSFIIVEVKKPKHLEGKAQLRSYCNATGAPIGVWTNGQQISYYNRRDPNYFQEITDIPIAGQELEDLLEEDFTFKDLICNDKLAADRKTLKDIILELEDDVLANAGVDVFEEAFKLIFTKLYDEYNRRDDKTKIDGYLEQNLDEEDRRDFEKVKACLASFNINLKPMNFRNTGQSEAQLKDKIQNLFHNAKGEWPGVFPEDATFELSDSHLSICVSSLQDVKLFNSNLQVVDEAFEYLVSKSAKAEKGQFFTPRHVIDMCVKMLNPKHNETMIDTAAGSCGFPVHTIFQVSGSTITNAEISEEDKEYIRNNVFGIDFDEKTVRVARTLNLIAGDGQTNVLHLNTLDYERWSDSTERNNKWAIPYGAGFNRLKRRRVETNENKLFDFDILMANPPFAGDIKESRIIHQYELGLKPNGRAQTQVGRDILFIERNLDFLRPGGRMAIVLPQGRFNNASDKYIREFIEQQARILAVVSLHGNTFKPHTGTKTSVLFLQKWDDEIHPKIEDYPIFFAVSQKGGKNNSGDYVYLKDNNGRAKLDRYRHQIVDHDLHNHDGELPPGIAEAFIEWADQENLSFV